MKADQNIAKTIWGEFMGVGHSKAQQRQIQIVHAALKIIAKEGADRMTFDLLAKKCKVTRQLIIHYFPNREDLLKWGARFVRAHMQQYAVERLSKHPSSKDQLIAYTRSTFEWTRENPNYAKFWAYYYYICGLKKDFQKSNSELVAMGHQRIFALLEVAYKKGESKIKPSVVNSKLIQNIITAGLLSLTTENYDDIQKKIEDWTVQGVLRIAF
ncbi:MAG: TetR/AcrR family transcriptional regulator [Pseudomonadota bacterium]|nr:TetR/AcrR family transcriptional regulator [Pseudomonadota bacterium]